MTYEMSDFQKDETKLRAKAKKGTITDEEFFKEMKRLHKRATESIVIEDNKILLDTPYGYKQVSSIEDDVAYLYDGAVIQLTPEEIDEISGNTIEEEIDVGQIYEAGTSDGAKKGWDKRGRGRKAEDEPEGTGDVEQPEDDPDDTRPTGADGQRLGKSAEDWEKEGYDVQIDRSMGTIAITKNGEDVWFSQSHEDNIAMFGDDWDNWDSQLILNTLEGGGQVGEWDSQLDSGYDPSTGDKKEEPDGNKQKELETHKQEREKGSSHTDLTLQKKWLKSPEDVERATDEEIFALANGDQMNKAQNPDGINQKTYTNSGSYYQTYLDSLRNSITTDLFGGGEISETPYDPATGEGGTPEQQWGNIGTNEQSRIMKELGIRSRPKNWDKLRPEEQEKINQYISTDTASDDEKTRRSNDFEISKSSRELVRMLRGDTEDSWSRIDSLRYASLLEDRSEYLTLNDFTNRDQTTLFKRMDDLIEYSSQQEQFKELLGLDGEIGNGYALKNRLWSKLPDQDKIKLLDFSRSLSNKVNKSKESKATEDSLIKIEDDKDDNTQVTVLDEWKNETHPDKNGKTEGIRTTKEIRGTHESKKADWTEEDEQEYRNEQNFDPPFPEELEESKASEYEKYTNNWWRNRKCQSCGKVLGDDWEKTPEAKTGDPLAGFRCEDCVDRLEDYRATYDPKFEGDDTGSQNPDLNDIWFGESKAREARIHQQTDVKKKWLERCETCGDIRSSHTAGIDHSFKVDATGVEFVDKGNVFENSVLIKSGLQPKRYSKEYISQQIQYEAQKWWHDNYAKKHGRKDFRDMTIIEKKKVFLAYLESVVGYGAKLPKYKSANKGGTFDTDVKAIYETVKRNANEVRKVLMEAKRVRFNNPDPKFWWNADEMRTGMVLNEFRRAGLEWYSVNSSGQLYDVLKDEAELVAGENKPLKEMSDDELLSAREYVYGTYKNLGYMKQIEAEIKDRGIGNPNFKKDWKDEETRDDKSVENDNKSEKDLEEITSANKVEEVPSFKDEIDKSLELEADEMYEDIQEAKPNTLIRYANPRKLPNGKTVMDRVRTSHPQVLESKADEWWGEDHSVVKFMNEVAEDLFGKKYGELTQNEKDQVNMSMTSIDDPDLARVDKLRFANPELDSAMTDPNMEFRLSSTRDEDHYINDYESLATEDVKDEDWFKEYQRNVDSDKAKISDLWKKDEKANEKEDIDLTCGMCNGTGEIYMDTIVTCHECNGTGKITFDQLPQWKKEQYASERNYRDNPINILDSAGLYDNWGYWDTWSRSDKYDLLMDRPYYDASEEDEYLTMSWSQLPDYMKKELNMAMFLRGEPTDDPYNPQFSESKAIEGGFGSGKRGHSSWMKDIEFGGNYKKCPLCNINTNFTSGKCEICGNSFAGEKKKASEGEAPCPKCGSRTFVVPHDAYRDCPRCGYSFAVKPTYDIDGNFIVQSKDWAKGNMDWEIVESKANEMNEDEWINKVEQLANKTGVKTIAVQNFLISVGNNGSVGNALANLESDARMYKWNARTVNAIQKGIMIYFDKVKNNSSQTFEDKYPNTLW